MPAPSLLLMQLADSAFPAGGLNHSQGLEAAMQSGRVGSAAALKPFAVEVLQLQVSSSLPFVTAGHQEPTVENAARLDAACEATLCSNHVAKRASIAQGKGFLTAAGAAFSSVAVLTKEIKGTAGLCGHLAPIFGIVCRALDISLEEARRLFLFITLRSLLSAAVRLSICGPMQAQRMQADLGRDCIEALLSVDPSPSEYARVHQEASAVWGEEPPPLSGEEAALAHVCQTSPVLDVLQATHDRLYSRLFSS